MSQKRLVRTFEEIVMIDSVSGNEAEIHDFLKKKFLSLGLDVKEDNSKSKTGLGANNLIATLKGNHAGNSLMFSAHTDTVTPGNGIQMLEKDGILYSKGKTILGADDKAGIAIMIEAIERINEELIDTTNLEFILSPGEEIGLVGSSALDMKDVKSDFGYVLDSGGTVGKVTTASPTLFMYKVLIEGKSAHAGLEPEKGVSSVAILSTALKSVPLGRIDERTTTNIGVIKGGEATNIVMDTLILEGEVRAIDNKKADMLITEIIEAFESSALLHGGTVTIEVNKMATGFDISDDEPVMKLLDSAGKKLGYEIIRETSGGGSDANVFNEKGKCVVNLSIGYEKIHTTEEYIPIKEMEKAVLLLLELAKQHTRKNEVRQ